MFAPDECSDVCLVPSVRPYHIGMESLDLFFRVSVLALDYCLSIVRNIHVPFITHLGPFGAIF